MEFKKVVIKIGTSTLTHKTGLCNILRMEKITKVIADLKNSGKEVVVVTSGAVGIGAGMLGFFTPPKEIPKRQACASLGQCVLMNLYANLFSKYGYLVSQILLPQKVLDGAESEFNTKNTFDELLKRRIVPIVNANDTISTKELEFGDNDTLSAYVALLVDADLLIILTDLDGVFDKNPNGNEDAKLIKKIEEIDENLKNAVRGGPNSLGTGGMKTKLKAAKIVGRKEKPTVILNGSFPERMYGIFKGNIEGTLINLKKESVED